MYAETSFSEMIPQEQEWELGKKAGKGQRPIQRCVIELVTLKDQWGQSCWVCYEKPCDWLQNCPCGTLERQEFIHWLLVHIESSYLHFQVCACLRKLDGEKRPSLTVERDIEQLKCEAYALCLCTASCRTADYKGGTSACEPGLKMRGPVPAANVYMFIYKFLHYSQHPLWKPLI